MIQAVLFIWDWPTINPSSLQNRPVQRAVLRLELLTNLKIHYYEKAILICLVSSLVLQLHREQYGWEYRPERRFQFWTNHSARPRFRCKGCDSCSWGRYACRDSEWIGAERALVIEIIWDVEHIWLYDNTDHSEFGAPRYFESKPFGFARASILWMYQY